MALSTGDATQAPALLHEILDRVAQRYPDRIAVEIPPGESRPQRVTASYAELHQRAQAMTAALPRSVKPDDIIAILLPRDCADLYAAQLGILKAGTAFTCIDPKFPDEHLRAVIDDAEPVAIITDSPGRERILRINSKAPPIVDISRLPASLTERLPSLHEPRCTNLAYVIYTSGTTGKPKGVLIEHCSIVNLITSDIEYFGLSANERVAQCSSPAYDSSIEETWLAFSVGAALVLLDEDDTVRLGPDLLPWLARERITVFCPPPTLLRAMGSTDPRRDLPDLKLLYVGGEALPADLADLWSAGCWMENGYGPTECTVTVVRGRINPGEAVTIGKPVRGSLALVLDADLSEVADGESGELCIAGASLRADIIAAPDLTAEKFRMHEKFGRIYRTGDLVRRNSEGNLECLGRIDSQIKLRGYRIELEAIEAILATSPGVRGAACKVQGDAASQILVAHIVSANRHAPPAVELLKDSLRRSLPAYMTPRASHLSMNCPRPWAENSIERRCPISPRPPITATAKRFFHETQEQAIASAFVRSLNLQNSISIDDDFFIDLGGDSLSAVGVICELRAADANSNATVRDLYEARTVARLAELLTTKTPKAIRPQSAQSIQRPRGRPILSTTVQCLWLALELIAGSAIAYVVVFHFLPLLLRNLGLIESAMIAPLLTIAGLLIYAPLSIAIVVILKRSLIGRYETIRAPVWGGFFTRHWIVTSAARLIPWWLIEGTGLMSIGLRALGAKVGQRIHIHRGVDFRRGGWDLLTIGDDVTLCQDAAIRLVELSEGQIIIGPISIGQGATVDTRAGLGPNSAIGSNGHLTPLSWLPGGSAIGENEAWDGVPASKIGAAAPTPAISRSRAISPNVHTALILLGHVFRTFAGAIPLILTALLARAFVSDADDRILEWLNSPHLTFGGLALIVIIAAIAIFLSLFAKALAMRAIGRIRPGVVPQFSLDSLRIWLKTGILDSASRRLSGAIFWPWWLRLAGMKIEKGCEISTIIDTLPETVSIGRESFFADGIYFCAPRRYRGTIAIAQTSLGPGTFLGNHAVVPAGHDWPNGLFVGVSTPADPKRAAPDSNWFGHPPIELPRRQVIPADRTLTHDPTPLLYLTRLFWELLRFALPALPIAIGYQWYAQISAAAHHFSPVTMILLVAPLLTLAAGASLCLAIVILKWLLLGRTKPGQRAFWSCWCGRWDFLFMAWGYWARNLLAALEGTLLLNAFLRLTGVRIGRRVVLGHGFSQIVDPDMLQFDDDSTVACHFQAHSFEDRILKLDKIHIQAGATAADNAVIFYGAQIGPGASVDPHSVVMKRDQLQANIRYTSCPTRPVE